MIPILISLYYGIAIHFTQKTRSMTPPNPNITFIPQTNQID